MGYCPFPVLCRDTVVVLQQEGRGAHGKGVYARYRGQGCLDGVVTERDKIGLSCGTLYCVVQLFELQCFFIVHEHCS